MRGKLFLIGCLLLTVILAACHYRIAETVVPAEGREGVYGQQNAGRKKAILKFILLNDFAAICWG